MALLKPTYYVDSFANLPTRELREEHGVRGLGLDIDGSLTGHNEMTIPEAHIEKIQEVDEEGISMVVMTNTNTDDRLPRVDTLIDYIKQETGLELPAITSRAIGSGKPWPAIFFAAATILDLPPQEMAHFGDQIPKDILGASLARYGATVLGAPYGKGGDPRVLYLQRPAEALLRPFLGLPRHTSDFTPVQPRVVVGEQAPLLNNYSGGYHEAKQACYAAAIGMALSGGVRLANGKLRSGVAEELLAVGLAAAGTTMRSHERTELVLEELQDLAQTTGDS